MMSRYCIILALLFTFTLTANGKIQSPRDVPLNASRFIQRLKTTNGRELKYIAAWQINSAVINITCNVFNQRLGLLKKITKNYKAVQYLHTYLARIHTIDP